MVPRRPKAQLLGGEGATAAIEVGAALKVKTTVDSRMKLTISPLALRFNTLRARHRLRAWLAGVYAALAHPPLDPFDDQCELTIGRELVGSPHYIRPA